MPQAVLPDLAIVLTFIRQGEGWSQSKLAREAGTTPKVINDYEHGRKPLNRPRLEKLLACMAVPSERVDATLSCLAGTRATARAPADPGDRFAEERRHVDAIAFQIGRLAEGFSRSVLELLTVEGEALAGRQDGEMLWRRLKQRSAAERRLLIEKVAKYRHWALVERVAAESIELAANHPRQALELAELSLFIAERVTGDAAWQARLAGYAGVHVANGQRVCNDLHAMEAALVRALKLWEEGASGDPGILNEAVVPWIEAACRRAQRRFPEALKRIDEALALDGGALRGQILMTQAHIFEVVGDIESLIEVLSAAWPLVDGNQEPRLAFGLRFNWMVALCHLDRASDAELMLTEIRDRAERLGEPLDLVRVVWLEGKIRSGLGQARESQRAFEQARRTFKEVKLGYDYSLVSLDLAMLLLKEGRTTEVREIATEMIWIFKSEAVHREALAALKIFCEAAKREAATVGLTRRVARYLCRAVYDPELKFEVREGAEGQ